MVRPRPDEYAPYYHNYVSQVPEGDILTILREGIDRTAALFANQPDSVGDRRYAPGKWTIREVLSHVVDGDRVFGFRAFWFARQGAGELPSYDQEPFVARSGASSRPLTSLFDEWRAIRAANIALFETIDDEASMRTGIASGNRFTVRSLVWIAAGHEIHHRKQLEERYGVRS